MEQTTPIVRQVLVDRITIRLLWWFCFFIAFPVIDIPLINVSITFPIFLIIVARTYKMKEWRLIETDALTSFVKWMFIFCGISVVASWRLTLDTSIMRDFSSFLYAIYWFYVFVFFRYFSKYYSLETFAHAFLLGSFASTLVILLGTLSEGWYHLGFFHITQNVFAFNLVAAIGVLSLSNLFRKQSVVIAWLIALYFIGAAIISQSRTGGMLVFVEMCLILFFRRYRSRLILVTVFLFLLGGGLLLNKSFLIKMGEIISPISPRLGALLEDTNQVNERDKSWLIRKVQVEKGMALFKEHPFLGIGWRHFPTVFVEVDVYKYKYLPGDVSHYTYNRSSHNTYIQQLSETGVFGLISLLAIQLWIIWHFLQSIWYGRFAQASIPIGISLLAVALYFWVISAMTGALWYVILGIFGASVDKEKDSL